IDGAVPDDDAGGVEDPLVDLVRVRDEEDAAQDAEAAADDTDEEAVGDEDTGDAFFGAADGFDDADVAGFVADDLVEDQEDDDEDDERHHAEDEDDDDFFVFYGTKVFGLFFVPGLNVEREAGGFGVIVLILLDEFGDLRADGTVVGSFGGVFEL